MRFNAIIPLFTKSWSSSLYAFRHKDTYVCIRARAESAINNICLINGRWHKFSRTGLDGHYCYLDLNWHEELTCRKTIIFSGLYISTPTFPSDKFINPFINVIIPSPFYSLIQSSMHSYILYMSAYYFCKFEFSIQFFRIFLNYRFARMC